MHIVINAFYGLLCNSERVLNRMMPLQGAFIQFTLPRFASVQLHHIQHIV